MGYLIDPAEFFLGQAGRLPNVYDIFVRQAHDQPTLTLTQYGEHTRVPPERQWNGLLMGMRVYVDPKSRRPPHRVLITVTCDGNQHGFFDAPEETFDCTDCHPRDPVLAKGWKFLSDGPVLGPCCA